VIRAAGAGVLARAGRVGEDSPDPVFAAMPPASSNPRASAFRPDAPQFELFPVRPVVEVLDARALAGPRTGVEHLVRVRWHPEPGPHLVFHDRHGWYCQEHGPGCRAVPLAREAVA